jgi:2-methylisocitrate lyase-like PEP mutase family enzyme
MDGSLGREPLSAMIGRPGHGIVAPGVYDALTALLAEEAGFSCLYVSGAAVAYSRLGRPDLGLVSVTEMADTVARIADRVSLPLIVDADTGFGNALNVQRTMRLFERAGATAIQLEDQEFPKRCGHLAGKRLIPAAEMEGKIAAARAARGPDGPLVIARTDAIAVDGFDAAIARAEAYLAAGADALFIEAPSDRAQMAEIGRRFGDRVPLVANMVEGGRTPLASSDELVEMGFRIVIFPGGIARAVAHHARAYYQSLLATKSNAAFRDRMTDFDGLNDAVGLSDLLREAERYG